jgi:hypothetical protein
MKAVVPAVSIQVAQALVLKYLTALTNYTEQKAARLAEVLSECTVSVDHAEATLRQFEDLCPNPREIREAACNLRQRFLEPAEDPRNQRCGICGGTGFRIIERNGLSAATPCTVCTRRD